MSLAKKYSIQNTLNEISDVRNKASQATEKLNQAFSTWLIAWDTYIIFENKINKTEFEIAYADKAYATMCLAWKAYEKEALSSNEVYSSAFMATNNLHNFMRNK